MEQYGFLGRGLRFPVAADSATGRLLESDGEENIREAILIILGTRKGERMMRPEFGSNIWQYLFSSMDFQTRSMMEGDVLEALTIWEPRITDVRVNVSEGEEPGLFYLSVDYRVRATNNPYNLVYPFYLEEGIGGE